MARIIRVATAPRGARAAQSPTRALLLSPAPVRGMCCLLLRLPRERAWARGVLEAASSGSHTAAELLKRQGDAETPAPGSAAGGKQDSDLQRFGKAGGEYELARRFAGPRVPGCPPGGR